MEDLIKKFLYTGVGLASITAEKFQSSIEKLVDENKITSDEGKKIVSDFFKKTESKKEDLESSLKKVSEDVIAKFDFSKSKEFKRLETRIAKLEAELRKSKSGRTTKAGTSTIVKKKATAAK